MLDLKTFYGKNHFQFDDKLAYGIYRNRLMSILPFSHYVKVTISFNRQLTQQQGQQISSKMREIKMANRALQNAITTNIYLELILYQSADINVEFFPILEKCLDVLDTFEIATCEICPICGQNLQTNSPFVRIKDSVIQGHESCVVQLISTTSNLNQSIHKRSKKNLGKTLLIAFSVMAICLILITLVSLGGLFNYFSLLTGWLCYLFIRFTLSKIKMFYGKSQWITNIVFSSLTILLSIYLGSVFEIHRQLDSVTYGYVFQNYFSLFASNFDTFGKFIIFDLILGMVFILLPSFSDYKKLNGFKDTVKRLK